MATNYTAEQVQELMAAKNIVSSKLYELLPEIIRDNDPMDALKAFFGAVQTEYDRNKDSITDVLMLVDPVNINANYVLEGSPVFFYPEQFLTSNSGATTATNIVFDGNPAGVSGNGFYNGFGVYVWRDFVTPESRGQYRRIVDYNGSTKVATLDLPWTINPGGGSIIAMCWPDRIFIPTEIIADPTRGDGTLLPDQRMVSSSANRVVLPNLFYISDRNDYYKGWDIEFLDGDNQGLRFPIVTYLGDESDPDETPFTAQVAGAFPAAPQAKDWFKLIPPSQDQVSVTNDFYKDRWVRIISGTEDATFNNVYPFRIQNRRILRSEYRTFTGSDSIVPAAHVCFIADDATGEGERWEVPPGPDFIFGITNHFVSLNYLARQVGFDLDALDAEELQREQIRQAFNFYKLKGTRRAIELIARSFGLEASVTEQASNYVHPPDPINVGPGSCSPTHKQYPWSEVTPHIERGLGEDEVPCNYLTATSRDDARIPDSDIKIFLSRINPKAFFDSTILDRILDKVEIVRPIHVEIILVGFLQVARESIDLTEDLQFAGTFQYDEDITVAEGFFGTPTGTVIVPTSTEGLGVDTFLLIFSEARYDVIRDNRHDGILPKPVDAFSSGAVRYDVGTIYHEGD